MSNLWQYYLLRSMSFMICLLPYRWILFLGNNLGKLYYKVAARQRNRALSQIQERLEISSVEAECIIKSLCRKLGQTLFEIFYIPTLTPAKMQKYVTIENRHYLDDAMKDGQGVVLLAAHIGNWEWLGAALSMVGFPIAGISKRQPNEQHTRLLNEYREMTGIKVYTRGTTELISAARAIKDGRLVAFLADQDAGPDGLFIDFLGKVASTPIGPAVFAKKFNAPIVPIFMVRKPEGGHRAIMYPPLYYKDTGNKDEDILNLTIELNKVIEATIRQYPDEWIWFQKRWNTSKS